MILPKPGLNGSNTETLATQYEMFRIALDNALQSFSEVEFHLRDYVLQGDEACTLAIRQRKEIIQKLRDCLKYAEAHSEHLFSL